MNTLILIVALVGAVVGFCQGAFKQIAKFVGIFAGVLIASMYSEKVGEFLSATTGTSAGTGKTFAYVLIIILAPVALGIVASLLTKAMKSIHLDFANRVVGAVVGAVCYLFVLSFAFNLMDFAESGGGFSQSSLEQREEPFYIVKHLSQPVVPDVIIVDDSAEVSKLGPGETPRCGLKPAVDKAIDEVNPFN